MIYIGHIKNKDGSIIQSKPYHQRKRASDWIADNWNEELSEQAWTTSEDEEN